MILDQHAQFSLVKNCLVHNLLANKREMTVAVKIWVFINLAVYILC